MTICTNIVESFLETHQGHIPTKFEVNLAEGFAEELKNVNYHCNPH